jgi:NADH dehydrogenase (ubiquinone) 1 alpha subcomplex subunit 4
MSKLLVKSCDFCSHQYIYKQVESDSRCVHTHTFYILNKMTQLTQFLRRSATQPEIYPLVAVLSLALGAGVYMGFHQAHAPDVVWNHKTNEQPWHQVQQGDQVKLAAYHQKYDRKFHRKEW